MPQRLSNLVDQAWVFLGDSPGHFAQIRPDLRLSAIEIVAEWSTLQAFLAGLFIRMRGTEAARHLREYLDKRDVRGQQCALREAARNVIATPSLENDILEKLLSQFKGCSAKRNKFAHWIWGHTPQLPNMFLLANPTMLAQWQCLMSSWQFNPQGDPPIYSNHHVLAYSSAELESLISEIVKLTGWFHKFSLMLNTAHPANWEGAVRRELAADLGLAVLDGQ